MYFQLIFILDRVKVLVPQHPEWTTAEPFASVLKGDLKSTLSGGEKALLEMFTATSTGMTTAEYEAMVSEWAYDRQSSVGRLDKALDEAQAKGWNVVDLASPTCSRSAT